METIKSSVWEIKKSSGLRVLGGVLALSHFFLFFFWYNAGPLPFLYLQEPAAMCWPYMPSCQWLRLIPFSVLHFVFLAYGVLSLIAFLVFFFTRFVRLAYVALLLTFFCGIAIYFQDYRLSSNSGYMLFLLSFCFLFIPDKARLFRWLLVTFFIATGLLKLEPEWLTGSWFLHLQPWPAKLGEWLAALSLLIEFIGGITLLFRDGRYFWTGWITLLAYQCFLWFVGGYWGPVLLIGLLVALATQEIENRRIEREYIYQSFIHPEPSKFWANVILGLMWISLAASHVHVPGQRYITPLSTFFSPHPVVSRQECLQTNFAVFKNHTQEIQIPERAGRPANMRCHPYLRYLDIKSLCQRYKKDPSFVTISSYFRSRTLNESKYHTVFQVGDFCDASFKYNKLGLSAWNSNVGL